MSKLLIHVPLLLPLHSVCLVEVDDWQGDCMNSCEGIVDSNLLASKGNMRTLHIGIVALFAATLGFSQADNTKMNKRDGSGKGMTAQNQMENKTDLEITRKIRKSLTDDKTLSSYAKNVKIISRNGKVTLKGPVNTEEEKSKIDGLAKSAAGADNVTNQIEIVKKS